MGTRTYKTKNCLVCQKEHNNRGKTCSKECANKKRLEHNLQQPLICILCGEEFFNKMGKGKYCSKTHYKKCAVCGKDFPIPKFKESKENPTCGASCGAKYSHRKEETKELRKINSLKKWGVEYPFQAEEIKQKIEKKLVGTAGRFGTEASRKAMKEIYGVENASQLDFVKEKKANTFKKNYTDKGIYPSYGSISKINQNWRKKLEEETGLNWEFEKFYNNVGRIDLYCQNKDKEILVEINPTATHNSYNNLIACYRKNCDLPCLEHALPKDYHYNRAKLLKEQYNISLTSVFDWMNEDKIISFIKSKLLLDKNKIYAKKTKIVDLSQLEANRFLKEYHMLGGSRLQKHCYGLFYDNELVQVQTFAPIGKDIHSFEAKRLATKKDWAVIGGVSKITKHFIKTVEPEKIVAFSDLNLSYPDYDVNFNGFERVGVNKPQKCWSKGKRMILDKSAARQSADRLIGFANDSKNSKYPENWSNEQVFLAEGWLPVYDCGMIKDQLIINDTNTI